MTLQLRKLKLVLTQGLFVVTGVQNGETTLTVRAGAASTTVNVIIDDEARNGWYEENGKHYWYVDGERQGLQKGGLEFTDPDTGCRYWLDPDDSGARAENRKVQLDEDRLCYFDENGCMHLANIWSTEAGTITMKRPVPSAAGLWCCRMAARCFTA